VSGLAIAAPARYAFGRSDRCAAHVDNQQVAFRFLQDIASDLSKREASFPTFANATLKIRRSLEDPSIDAERIGRVIASEPLVAAKLVKIANSAAVNLGGKPISDVRTAVTRVGFETVRSVAVAVAMDQLRAAGEMQKYAHRAELAWSHSLQVAALAYVIAQKTTRLNPEEALFAGLVHDIGYFYLLSQACKYPELDADANALDDVLADWHAPIGQTVLHSFGLAPATLSAVAEHENGQYRMPARSVADVVTLANLVAAQTNPIHVRPGATPPSKLNEPELFKTLAEASAEIRSLVTALRT
jgi:HD-like signal output (HDOD) protein